MRAWRWACWVAILGAILGASSGPAFAQGSGSDWPGFLGPFGNGVSPENGIIAPWPKAGLKVLWHKKLGGGYGPPAVRDGKLYVFDRQGNKARLLCLKADSGDEVWKFTYPTSYNDKFGYSNGPRCGPVVDKQYVYIHGAEGLLHCIACKDGKPIWHVDTRKDFGVVQNFFGVASHPVIEGDLLIVQVGGSPPKSDRHDFENLKGNGSGIVAFDKLTGKVRYRITDELASYSSPVLATIKGRRWCFVLTRGGLVGFEPSKGKVDFHFPWRAEDLESVNGSNPVVAGDRVFISECYDPGSALLKIKPGGYQVLWDDAKRFKKSMQCHWMTPIVHDGYLYGCSGRHKQGAQLRCIELATGKVMWSQPRLGRTSLLMVDGHFICLSELGSLLLLKVNPKKFDLVSVMIDVTEAGKQERLLEEPCWAAPILAHGRLYIRSEERLVCLQAGR